MILDFFTQEFWGHFTDYDVEHSHATTGDYGRSLVSSRSSAKSVLSSPLFSLYILPIKTIYIRSKRSSLALEPEVKSTANLSGLDYPSLSYDFKVSRHTEANFLPLVRQAIADEY